MVIRRTQSRPIKEIIEEVLKASGIDQKLKERELIRQWDEVVGITIARSTDSIYISDRKLIVKIRSSVIRNELTMISTITTEKSSEVISWFSPGRSGSAAAFATTRLTT